MATSPPVQRNTFNSSADGTPSNSRTRDWARSEDPSTAFSGLTKGKRGGGGRGSGRGGRGGRGGGRGAGTPRIVSNPPQADKPAPAKSAAPSAPKSASKPDKSATKPVEQTSVKPPVEKPEIKQPEPAVPSVSNLSDKPAPSSSTQKSKSSSRRSSTRSIPSIVLPPTTSAAADAPPTPKSARPPNHRRRSQNGSSRAPATAGLKSNIPPPLDQNLLRTHSQNGSKRLPQPPHTAPLLKDAPPHLSTPTAHDLRTDIDALVERVRAVAMDRPSTPGSHIDWAGDDDDSLPDLDDWGVPTASNTASKLDCGNGETGNKDTISPIMVEGLRSLPEPFKPDTPEKDAQSLPTTVGPLPEHPPAKEQIGSETDANPAKKPSFLVTTEPVTKAPSHSPTKRVHPHPSLPPKPVFADTSLVPNHRRGVTPIRNPALRHPQSDKSNVKPVQVNAKSAEEAKPVQQTQKTEHAPIKSEDISTEVKQEEKEVEKQEKEEEKKEEKNSTATDDFNEGLQSSIHAPAAHSDSTLDMKGNARPVFPPPRNFTHNRAHTVGRPPSFLHSAPAHGNNRFSRSGFSTPRNGHDQSYHARTHSSPPAGAASGHHRTHSSRPIITGDAISRLARTIGGASLSPSPSRTAVSLSTKD
ncbi:hypothetical protein D9758_001244 [Tetrapyrgos nigripes]|uniref:Uncharacterized protein n=1 Tax=Tetrapyrgos nigripes TaxID=182062 RepID=A0A8H5LUN5_9AGAR|nr:hypothetical protein D9758_001244 [Tetrapyrgos nigripes]